MRTVNDIVIPEVGLAALREAFASAIAGNEEAFRKNREQLVDFYLSQQTDEDRYLKAFFDRQTKEGEPPEYPHNLVLSQTNLTAKMIDVKAKTYRVQPVRMIDGAVVEEYKNLLVDGGIKTASKLIDRFTWLLGDHCVVVIADAEKKRLRFDNPTYYRPIFAEGNSMDPVAVMYPIGLVRKPDGTQVQAWQYWDAEVQAVLEDSTWEVIGEEIPNPHGCFNVLFTHRIKPFRGHWTRDAQDLIDTNRDVNILVTSINNAFRRVGFPNIVFKGIKAPEQTDTYRETTDGKVPITQRVGAYPEKPGVKVGFDQAFYLHSDNPDAPVPDAAYLIPGVDWNQLIGVVKSEIELLSTTWNVNIRWDVSGDIASGVALRILSIDNLDDLADMQELYEECFEFPLYEKVLAMQEKVDWIKDIKKGRLTVDWAEPEFIESPTERNARLEGEIGLNLTNPIDVLKADNPDLDDAAALKLYIRNLRVNRLLKGKASGAGSDVMSALLGNFDERGSFETDAAQLAKDLGIEPNAGPGETPPNPEMTDQGGGAG